jgi:hypothetical protein
MKPKPFAVPNLGNVLAARRAQAAAAVTEVNLAALADAKAAVTRGCLEAARMNKVQRNRARDAVQRRARKITRKHRK